MIKIKAIAKTTLIHYPLEEMVPEHTFHNPIFRIYRLNTMKQTEVPIIFAMSNDPSTYMQHSFYLQQDGYRKRGFMI
jgi:hypothetical protein